jgi:hypothetical protein
MSWVITGSEKTPVDPQFGSVSLLLHGNGTNGSTTITDSSRFANTVTAVGNAQISTAQSKFGGASIAFDGTGDCLSIADSSSFDLGTGDFTIETWAYIAETGDYTLYSHAATGGPMLLSFEGTFRFRRFGVADVVVASALPSTNTWVHIAASRNGTATKLFFNGVQTGSTATDTADYTVAASVFIGSDTGAPGALEFNGYIDDLRITKGVARYTANFTPPTAPFPDM